MMKVLQQILFTFLMVVGLSLAISAQKNDDQKKPPPKNPPVVNPGTKPPPRENPPPNKPKKPGFALVVVRSGVSVEIV